MNDMREQIWKGLLSHDPAKGANQKTYMNRLIKNRFGVLLKKCQLDKHTLVTHYADVFTSPGVDEGTSDETPETVLERREAMQQHLPELNDQAQQIYMMISTGMGIAEIMTATKLQRPQVVSVINKIAGALKNFGIDHGKEN